MAHNKKVESFENTSNLLEEIKVENEEIKEEEYDSPTTLLKEELDINKEEQTTNFVSCNGDSIQLNSENTDEDSKNFCEKCGKSFIILDELNEHLKFHTGEKQLSCTDTGVSCTNRENPLKLKLNLKFQNLLHANKNNDACKELNLSHFNCPTCCESFELEKDLLKHKLIHVKKSICNKPCAEKSSLKTHELIHTKETIKRPQKVSTILKEELDIKDEELTTNLVSYNGDTVQLNSENTDEGSKNFCEKCGKSFIILDELNEHLKLHTGEKQLSCTDTRVSCTNRENSFKLNLNLKFQNLLQANKNNDACKELNLGHFNCPTCCESFELEKDLLKHKLIHAKKSICNKPCAEKSGLKTRERIHTKATRKRPQKVPTLYTCEICGIVYKQESRLNRHKKIHAAPLKHPCEICGKLLKNKACLKAHKELHTNEYNFICEICGKSFKTNNYLRLHLNVHTNKRNCECTICGKFFTPTYIQQHKIIHTEENSYTCGICGKSIKGKQNVDRHKLSAHTGDKKYSCLICGKSFGGKATLVDHIAIHTGERKYKCKICGKMFQQRSALSRHRRTHPNRSCTICGKRIYGRGNFKQHLKTHKNT